MYVLDTNVVSELRKARSGKADPGVVAWAATLPTSSLYISVITVLELEQGVLRKERSDPAQGLILRTWLNHQVLPSFHGRVLPIDTAVAQRCAPDAYSRPARGTGRAHCRHRPRTWHDGGDAECCGFRTDGRAASQSLVEVARDAPRRQTGRWGPSAAARQPPRSGLHLLLRQR